MVGPGFGLNSFPSLDGPAKREVKTILGDIVEDWDQYDVGDLDRAGDKLTVELHHTDKSVAGRHKVTVEIDHNP